tara:strand:+ start:45055 stop:45768 length:714 start_codon:yes stop_codon:yes gene_type:complete
METGKTGKYFKYAIGEIVLVVIGILIALQINNWNESRKQRVKEIDALENIKTSLLADLKLYNGVFKLRLGWKQKGLEYLKEVAYYKRIVPEDSIFSNYFDMGTDIVFRYDSGSYDALKSSGFDLIQNKELRKKIINTYQILLPAYMGFINDKLERSETLEAQYKRDLFKDYVTKTKKNKLDVWVDFKVDNVLEHPSFLGLLRVEQGKYNNFISRIKTVTSFSETLIKEIEIELQLLK